MQQAENWGARTPRSQHDSRPGPHPPPAGASGLCLPSQNHALELSLLFGHSVVSDSLQAHGLPHARLPCPSLPPGGCSNSRPSRPLSPPSPPPPIFAASGSFPMTGLKPQKRVLSPLWRIKGQDQNAGRVGRQGSLFLLCGCLPLGVSSWGEGEISTPSGKTSSRHIGAPLNDLSEP